MAHALTKISSQNNYEIDYNTNSNILFIKVGVTMFKSANTDRVAPICEYLMVFDLPQKPKYLEEI